MERLTKRTKDGIAYLAKVREKEQEIEASKNTCECMYESWQRLADYEDAEEQGRLVRLPCKVGGTVFTIDEVFYPCRTCEEMGRTEIDACYKASTTPPFTDAAYECPIEYEIHEHTVEGYMVGDGGVGLAGEWGYEGLETFTGYDGKQFLTRAEAEAVLDAQEGAKPE